MDGKRPRRFRRPAGLRGELLDWMESILISVAVVVLIFTFLLRPVGVDGDSMRPTLEDGDRLLVTHLFYTPRRGDIVVVNSTGLGKLIVKRVIGLPGDTVDIDFERHEVYVNGEEQNEPYIDEPTQDPEDVAFPVTVSENALFVMGDNRNNSQDSRSAAVGQIDEEDIIGKAVFRLYPFSSVGFIS